MLLSTLIISLPAIANVGALLALLFFLFAYMGEGVQHAWRCSVQALPPLSRPTQ